MSDLWPVPDRVQRDAVTPVDSLDAYRETWMRAANDPNGFWLAETCASIAWDKAPTMGLEGDYRSVKDTSFSWFADGELNVTTSCIDRHADATPDKTAILWEGDEPGDVRRISYGELRAEVSKLANALRARQIQKGDRVIIYMGMVPEAAVAMLACARIGAVHSVVFGGFSAEALRDRVRDCGAELVITQDVGLRGGRQILLKATVDAALEGEYGVRHVVVFKRRTSRSAGTRTATSSTTRWPRRAPMFARSPRGGPASFQPSAPQPVEGADAHVRGGYITYAGHTYLTVFDLRLDDVVRLRGRRRWDYGHSYIVHGPLANGATSLMFESTPLYPDGRYWDMAERHKITIFYTAPTAIRALAYGDEPVKRYDRSSVRVLGTVGEPINPEAWVWYREVVGENRCNIVDTWWQTETGGICISPTRPRRPRSLGPPRSRCPASSPSS